ncbi:MAG: polysaccharide biosynthesis protein [Clostridia bacterium]|nr:polysaccharide biosynthesis protein [Clostridia bacterium]
MKNRILSGTLLLSAGSLLSKLLGAIYRIPLSNILGTQGIGVYQMIFPLYSLCLVLLTGGISVFVSQKVSTFRARGDCASINAIFRTSKKIALLYGFVVSCLLAGLSFPLASVQGNTSATLGYIAVAASFVFSCLSAVYRGYFQGFSNMVPTSLSAIIEQGVKLVLGLLFSALLVKEGIVWGVFGALVGVSVSEVLSFLYLASCYNKNKKQVFEHQHFEMHQIIKSFLPLSVTAIMLPLVSAYDGFFAVTLMQKSGLGNLQATSLFGIYSGMITPILNFPIIFCTALCIAVLPSLSFDTEKKKDTSNLVSDIFFYVWLLAVPCALGLMAVSEFVLAVCFPTIEPMFYPVAVLSMQISCLNIIWLSVISLTTAILQANGKYTLPAKGWAIALFIKIFLTLIIALKSEINIIGLAMVNSFIYFISCSINLLSLKKYIKFGIKSKQIIMPVFFGLIMSAIIVLLKKILFFNNFISLILLVLCGIVIYFSLLIIFKIINLKNIKNYVFNKNKLQNKT